MSLRLLYKLFCVCVGFAQVQAYLLFRIQPILSCYESAVNPQLVWSLALGIIIRLLAAQCQLSLYWSTLC